MFDSEYIQKAINYSFTNSELLKQSFSENSCDLQLYGKAALSFVLAKEYCDTFGFISENRFCSKEESAIFEKRVSDLLKDANLTKCVERLGLLPFVQNENAENPIEKVCASLVKAIFGAVAVDSGWDFVCIKNVVDSLVFPQGNFDSIEYQSENFIVMLQKICAKHNIAIQEFAVLKKEKKSYTARLTLENCFPKINFPRHKTSSNANDTSDSCALVDDDKNDEDASKNTKSFILDAKTEQSAKLNIAKKAYIYVKQVLLFESVELWIMSATSQLKDLKKAGFVQSATYRYKFLPAPCGGNVGLWECNCTVTCDSVKVKTSSVQAIKKTAKEVSAKIALSDVLEKIKSQNTQKGGLLKYILEKY